MITTFEVKKIRSHIQDKKLCITAEIQELPNGPVIDARLPAREAAALLPREIIIGEEKEPTTQVLKLMDDMLSKLVTGRIVRTWEYSGITYFSFLKWGGIRFDNYCPSAVR